VIGSVVVSAMTGPIKTSFVPASHAGWWVIAGCGLSVFTLGVITTGPWARHTAELVAAAFGHGEPAAGDGTEIEPAA